MKNKRHSNKIPRPAAAPGGTAAALRRWYADKSPILLFGARFCALTVLFYLLSLVPFCHRMIIDATVADARASSFLLNHLGQHNHVEGVTLLAGARSIITVVESCSGFDFLCFFTAAVLVFPVPFRRKLIGVLVGVPVLLALNVVRIMSLFLVGLHYPGAFDMVHEEIWALILIAASIFLYIAWMRWAGAATQRPLDATA